MAKQAIATLVSEVTEESRSFESWGDQHDWCELLPVAWKLIGCPGLSISRKLDGNINPSWWFTPLHLLGVGLGWTDIARGLEHWRLEGYTNSHPILEFLHATYGPSIEALEIWLKTPAGTNIFNSLALFSDEAFKHEAPLQFASDREFESAVEGYKSKIRGNRTRAGFENLLVGGTDPQHLEAHFSNLLKSDSAYNPRDRVSPIFRSENIGHETYVELPSMKGILGFLKLYESELTGALYMGGAWTTLVSIEDIGLKMPFQYEVSTARWYWNAQLPWKLDASRVHYWGNCRKA